MAVAVALTACGGGGGGSGGDVTAEPAPPADGTVQPLGCAPDLTWTLAPGSGELANNAWNATAAGSASWSQCLQQRGEGTAVESGWAWRWPDAGAAVYAYPSVRLGAQPWAPGPGNDARFPRALTALPSVVLDWDIELQASGQYNLAASMWFIRTPRVASPPVEEDIATEIMVWSDYTPQMIGATPEVTLRGEIMVDGRRWQVWAAEDWGAFPGVTTHRWRFVAYVALERTTTLRVDARRFIDDAIGRGLLNPRHYLASVELGNEIVSGSGSAWLRRFAVSGW